MPKRPVRMVCKTCRLSNFNPDCRILDPTHYEPTKCRYYRCPIGRAQAKTVHKDFVGGKIKLRVLSIDGKNEKVLPVETSDKTGFIILGGKNHGEFVAEHKGKYKKTGQQIDLVI
ncbi:MAG: hypothetical protein JXB14_00960 [Candidatus Altiarchaeota archaeon]|nr:hypothetical protein [Candidatus Altiarchaeota archaeon]